MKRFRHRRARKNRAHPGSGRVGDRNFAGRRGRVALKDDDHELEDFEASFFIMTAITPFNPVNKWTLYEALIKRKSDYCVRTFDGQRYMGVVTSLPRQISDTNGKLHGYIVNLKVTAIDIVEADI